MDPLHIELMSRKTRKPSTIRSQDASRDWPLSDRTPDRSESNKEHRQNAQLFLDGWCRKLDRDIGH
jgi:hypothetical protein